nr:NAD(P)/FAD-dependent oxidoreductase [Saccharopolyspora sp. ASAGF58]
MIIVGGGPVSCLVALRLRGCGFDVRIYEREADPRLAQVARGHSFNLTLTLRGLRALTPSLREAIYSNGVVLPQRIIHHRDGSLTCQPYAADPKHHLLSIPRRLLHHVLLTEAEKAGAEIFFNHECFGSDPLTATAHMVSDGRVIVETADLLIGCDGANSTVRHDMSRKGARLDVRQTFIQSGYVEMKMPSDDLGRHSLLHALRDPAVPESSQHGLHVWPRDDFMLLAQPNRDQTYTATLFMPLRRETKEQPSIERLRTPSDVLTLFQEYFPDSLPFLPALTAEFFSAQASSLRTITCDPFHFGRAVLLGDAAHTVVPFYGQGINCSFEDVGVLISLLDAATDRSGVVNDIPSVLAKFTHERRRPVDSITELSMANLRELSAHTGEGGFHDRNRLELELHARYPEHFAPLYYLVAFSDLPYHLAVAHYERDRQMLDELCRRHDQVMEKDTIIRRFVEYARRCSDRSVFESGLVASGHEGPIR